MVVDVVLPAVLGLVLVREAGVEACGVAVVLEDVGLIRLVCFGLAWASGVCALLCSACRGGVLGASDAVGQERGESRYVPAARGVSSERG